MTKASIGKSIVALTIMGVYIFLFGITGTLSGDDSKFISSEITQATEATTSPITVTDTAKTEENGVIIKNIVPINAENEVKPSYEDYSSRNAFYPNANAGSQIKPEPEITTSEEPPLIVDDTTTQAPIVTTSPTEQSTEPQTTPVTDTTTEPPVDTTPAVTTKRTDEEREAACNEILYVDTYSKGEISGPALEIVASAVQGEIGGLFHEEAIKAQAVSAYTYIKKHNLAGDAPIIANPTPTQRVLDIVAEVVGELIYYKGDIIYAVYYSSSAGYSASSYEVWGMEYPYLQSTFNELDEEYDPNWDIKSIWSATELKALAKQKLGITLTGDPSKWFEITSYVDHVYVGTMNIGGQSTYFDGTRNRIITGRTFRETMLGFDIKSHCFTIVYDENTDNFTITTRGYGHGVGFCQYGANTFANVKGWDYKQILHYYFIDCDIY